MELFRESDGSELPKIDLASKGNKNTNLISQGVGLGVAAALLSSGVANADDLSNRFNGDREEMNLKMAGNIGPHNRESYNYDHGRNSLTTGSSQKEVEINPILMPSKVLDSAEVKYLSMFGKENGEVLDSDIETKFGINLKDFLSVYNGSYELFERNSKITDLKKQLNEALVNGMYLKGDEKKKNEELVKDLEKKITQARDKMHTDYLREVSRKIQSSFNSRDEALSFLTYFQASTKEAKALKKFVLSIYSQKEELDVKLSYTETVYASQELISRLALSDEQVKDKFSEEEKTRYGNTFQRLRDVYNSRVLLEGVNSLNVLTYLSDMNNDGKVTGMDSGYYSGGQLLSLMNSVRKTLDEKSFCKNLSFVFSLGGADVSFENLDELVTQIKSNPDLKHNFVKGLQQISIMSGDLASILTLGEEGIKAFENEKANLFNNPKIGKLIDGIISNQQKLKNDLLKERNSGNITNQEYKNALAKIESFFAQPALKEKIFEQVVRAMQAISASYLSTSGNNPMSGVRLSYNNTIFTEESINKLITNRSSLEYQLGIISSANGNMLAIGLGYNTKININDNQSLNAGVGVRYGVSGGSQVLPVLNLGYVNNTNRDEIKGKSYTNLEGIPSLSKFEVTGNYAAVGNLKAYAGIFVGKREDKLEGLKIIVNELDKDLTEFFNYDGKATLASFMEGLERKINKDENKKLSFLTSYLTQISFALEAQNFDKVTFQEKKELIKQIIEGIKTDLISYYGGIESEKGYVLSGYGLNLSKFTIPGVQVSKIDSNYKTNEGGDILRKSIVNFSEKGEYKEIPTSELPSYLSAVLGEAGVIVGEKDGITYIEVEGKTDVIKALAEKGVVLYITLDKKISSQVGIKNGSDNWGSYGPNGVLENGRVNLGDVKTIRIVKNTSGEGKEYAIVVGEGSLSGKIPLTEYNRAFLERNMPISGRTVGVEIKEVSSPNSHNLKEETFGFAM